MQVPTDAELDIGVRLLEADDDDVYSFLGMQSEKLDLAERREKMGRPVPAWSDADAVAKVLSGQRASRDELLRYAQRGFDFARDLLVKLEAQLRDVLCSGTSVRKEIEELGDSTKEIVKYVSSLVVGVLLANVPGAVALAATSIATTLAVLLIKRKLTTFCAVGAQAIAQA